MRVSCVCDKEPLRPESCLSRQERWDAGEKGLCTGVHCARFVIHSYDTRAERLRWICRMETDAEMERERKSAARDRRTT